MYSIFSCLGRFCGVVSLCTLTLGLYVTSAHAQTFSPPKSISSAVSNSAYPAMVVDAVGHINVAWIDSAAGIIIASSADGGLTFPTRGSIPGSPGAAFQPQMVVDSTGNIIEIAWAKPSTGSTPTNPIFDVFVSRSIDGGATFLPQILTPVSTSVKLVSAPRLAFVGTGVDVVWGNDGTWISTSTDGTSFGTPIPLAKAAQDSGGPRIAVDKNANIFVAWTDRLAQDQGLSGNYCTNPTGNTNSSGIITVYTNQFGGNYYINETPSVGGVPGVPSSANTRNLSNTDFKGPDPSYPNGYYGCSYDSLHLFFDQNDNLHLLWGDDAPLEELLTSTAVPQTNGPPKFTFPIGLVGDEGVSSPSVATDSAGSIYVAWAAGAKAASSSEGIYFIRSDDDGANFVTTFSAQATVVSAPGAISPAYPQIAVDSSRNVNIAWEQADQRITAGSSNTFHLFFSRSIDRGDTFPTVREVSPNASVLCIPKTAAGFAPPNTPNTTTCGTVQMAIDANSNADMSWVNNPGSASNIEFSIADFTLPPPQDDFSISVTSATPTSFSGQTVTYSLTAAATGNFGNSAITLGCNDFPEVMGTQGRTVLRSDFSCTFTPASGTLTQGGTATVFMTIPADLPASSNNPYPFAINGTNGGTTHRVMVAFNDPGPAGSVQPSSATVAVGASATFNVNIINFNAFSGNVNLACSGQPAWIQCSFNPPSVTPSSTSSVLTVKVVSAPTGSLLSYPPSVRGFPGQRNVVLWSATGTALCLLAMALVFGGRREGLNAAILRRGFAVMALTLVLATGLISCGGGAAAPSNGATSTSSGTGSGGGSTPVTAKFMVQAQAGNGTTNLGSISITTP
jgi:hypothetical protein